MGEANVQTQNEPFANSPQPTPRIHKQPIIANSPAVEPTDQFSKMNLTNGGSCHRQPPFSAANNPMKRRSPPFASSSREPCAKKSFCDQEDPTLRGFSSVHIPLNISPLINKRLPVLRRCVSDPFTLPEPEQSTPQERVSRLPPLPPPRFGRSMSDIGVPSSDKALSCLSSEETAASDSVRLKRMKECFKGMRPWWDEVMKYEEEDGGGKEKEECAVAEDHKVPAQEDLGGGDSEEAVSVQRAGECICLGFKCPCGKGYEVLLSENNCYYKLV